MKNGYEHNYNVLAPRLANCDFEEAAARLGLNHPINDKITMHFLNIEYRIGSEGVFALDGQASDPNHRSILIHYITSKGSGNPEGNYFLPSYFLPKYFLPGHSGQGIFAGQNLISANVMRELGDSLPKIRYAMGVLGAEYEGCLKNRAHIWFYSILPKIPMQVIYYEADDEFPCGIMGKFDGCAGRFIEFETLAFLSGSFTHSLVELCKTDAACKAAATY